MEARAEDEDEGVVADNPPRVLEGDMFLGCSTGWSCHF